MAGDVELDRLQTAQDLAFRRKQEAYQAQQKTWDRLLSAKDELSRAHEEKQRAYTVQESAWLECQRIRSSNGPRIDHLNSMQTSAFENMKRAFDDASTSHDQRDGASAKRYSVEGHSYKSESQGYVAERRQLVEEIRSANGRLAAVKPAFEQAKIKFSDVKHKHDQLKSEHESAQAEFKRSKGEFDQVAKTFKTRLEFVRNERKLRREMNRRLAERAGVPHQYLNSVKVDHSPDGGINFFFGGYNEPDGPGHGHYATDRLGDVKYRREPYDPHGPQNFVYADNPRFSRYGNGFAESCTYHGMNAIRESGIDRVSGRTTIDIYYGGDGGEPLGKGHGHDVFFQDSPDKIISHRPPKRT